jgi:predicted phosphodiesterase
MEESPDMTQQWRQLNRRDVLKLLPAGMVAWGLDSRAGAAPADETWQMGLIADLHYGLAPDALSRLEKFMEEVTEIGPDCLLQLGDFNYGVKAEECLKLWNSFKGPRYHVLGNHDMDKTDKSHQVELWEMPGRYYSFDHKGWHIVVLDRNNVFDGERYIPYAKGNYFAPRSLRDYADPEQLEWLAEDLSRSTSPLLLFTHQGLGMTEQLEPDTPSGRIETILAKISEQNPQRPMVVLCGHHHIERYQWRDGIHYVCINSASYSWLGEKYGGMAPYRDPLYTFLTLSADGTVEIRAKKSIWNEPTPRDRGYPNLERLASSITGRRLPPGRSA